MEIERTTINEKLITYNIIDESQHEATQKCTANGKYFATSLLVAAWGFLFEEELPFMRILLIATIILGLIYFACDTWRSFKIANDIHKLWKKERSDNNTYKDICRSFNKMSDWSFCIFKIQLVLLVLIVLVFIIYCVFKLIMI